jgi:hypothetical protein
MVFMIEEKFRKKGFTNGGGWGIIISAFGLVAQLGGRVVRKAMQKSQLQAKKPSWQKSCKKRQNMGS